jgi:hypothetical protein
MIVLWIILLGAALGAFYLLRKRSPWLRWTATLLLFPGAPLLITGWVVSVGDKAPPDAITVTPKRPAMNCLTNVGTCLLTLAWNGP